MPAPTVVDLFAGAGGLSEGLERAGFRVVAGIERDPDACASFARRHPGAVAHGCDVATFDHSHLAGVDVVAGGPPCQPFSIGGKRLAAEDPRNGFPQFIRAVHEIQPRAFLLENVAGVVQGERRPYFDWLVVALERLGYLTTTTVVNAADHGVPQRRRRVVVVGLRDQRFTFPEPTHGPGTPRPWASAGAVLGPGTGGVAGPDGDPNPSVVRYARNPDLRPDPYGGHLWNGGGRPIDPGRPAPTLLASMGGNKTPWVDTLGVVPGYHAHLVDGGRPREGDVPGARRITVAEAARLQTFDPAPGFVGSRSSRYRQVGNAVPPLLARAVGTALLAHLG